jgi:hypothetical protein
VLLPLGPANPINDTINLNGGYSIAAGAFNNDKAPDLAIPIQIKGKSPSCLTPSRNCSQNPIRNPQIFSLTVLAQPDNISLANIICWIICGL